MIIWIGFLLYSCQKLGEGAPYIVDLYTSQILFECPWILENHSGSSEIMCCNMLSLQISWLSFLHLAQLQRWKGKKKSQVGQSPLEENKYLDH